MLTQCFDDREASIHDKVAQSSSRAHRATSLGEAVHAKMHGPPLFIGHFSGAEFATSSLGRWGAVSSGDKEQRTALREAGPQASFLQLRCISLQVQSPSAAQTGYGGPGEPAQMWGSYCLLCGEKKPCMSQEHKCSASILETGTR